MLIFKKILLAFGIIVLCFNSFSQTNLELFEAEVSSLAKENYKINSVSFQSDSNWIITYSDNGFSASKIDSIELNVLSEMNKNGEIINQILKKDSFFLILYNHKFECISCPEALKNSLIRIEKNKETIHYTSFENGNYAIIHNNGEFTTNSPNAKLVRKLLEIQSKKLKLKQILIFKSGWLMSYGKAGIAAYRMQDNLLIKLNELKKQGAQIDFICHIGNIWYVIYNDNQLKKIVI